VFWAWYYFNKKLNVNDSRYFLAFGISFPNIGTFGNDDVNKIPQDEQFFFILFADHNERQRASALMSQVPAGWVQIYDETEAVTTRAVSQFSPNPDIRAKEVIVWAEDEVGRLVASIKGFSEAPIEIPPAEDEGS
jgi:hypothetical protein